MRPRILFLGSKSVAVALWATRQAHVKHISATLSTGKRLPRIIHLFILLLVICFTHTSRAITLERVLQTTLEKNPAIQEAKSGLEQAAGQRLVFGSVAWPHPELVLPAGGTVGDQPGE